MAITNAEYVSRFKTVYATVGLHFLVDYNKLYWEQDAANVMEGLLAMFRVTNDKFFSDELAKHITYMMDNDQGASINNPLFISHMYGNAVKFARMVTEAKLTQYYALRDRIVTFVENTLMPNVLASFKEFIIDNVPMVTMGLDGPIPFNQQDQIYVMMYHLSFIVKKPQYITYLEKFANFEKWSRVMQTSCYDPTKTGYTLAYRRYTGLPWDTTQGSWCSTPDCSVELNYANPHVDFVMECFFNGVGYNAGDVQLLINNVLYSMWNQSSTYPLISRTLGGCAKNLVPYNDFHTATHTGWTFNFIRLGVLSDKVLAIFETINDIIYQRGIIQNSWWTSVYRCVQDPTSGDTICYGDLQEQPDWMLRGIGNILVTRGKCPPGPGLCLGDKKNNLGFLFLGLPVIYHLFNDKKK